MAARRGWLAAAALGLALGGCASLTSSAPSDPGAGASPVARDPLGGRHRQLGVALARHGQLRRAAEEWKIALAIAPGDARARESLRALQARIDQAVAERLDEGRKA
ncbi:MAG: hypothetical protein ACHQ7H_24345, partial [Candidatus Rokuibacteriota bacterium]